MGQGGAEGGEQAFKDFDGIRSEPSRKPGSGPGQGGELVRL